MRNGKNLKKIEISGNDIDDNQTYFLDSLKKENLKR
jgi:hypothetical protein